MTIPTGLPGAPITDPMTIRLYDEIKEMRGDFGGLRSDIQGLLAKMDGVATQGHDHETRIRTWEREGATKEDVEALAAQVQDLQHSRWKTAGAAAAGASLVSSGVVGVVVAKLLGH